MFTASRNRKAASQPKPSFVGVWNCQFYNIVEDRLADGTVQLPALSIIPPGGLTLTIKEIENGRILGDFYNPPAVEHSLITGKLMNDGRVWYGVFMTAAEPEGLVSGRCLFVLEEDGNTFHGAWTGQNGPYGDFPDGPPLPWWGHRIK